MTSNLTSRRAVLLSAVAAGSAVASFSAALAEGRVQIEGVVTSSSGGPLKGVVVQVDTQGATSDETKDSGAYKVEVPGNAPIAKLSYSRSDLDYAVIEFLSGARSHNISKVMYKIGEVRPALAVIDTLGAYEHLAVAVLLASGDTRRAMIVQYQKDQWIARLSKLPIPAGDLGLWVESRKQQLLTLLERMK